MGGGDTAPRAGLVQQIRQNWAVYEDGALASRLQEEELEQHYHNNRHRNQQIREDIPGDTDAAHPEQLTAQVEQSKQRRELEQQAARDAEIARELAGAGQQQSHAQYLARREQVLNRRIERERRSGTSSGAGGGAVSGTGPGSARKGGAEWGLQYQEDRYEVQVARPATVTEEPLYANNTGESGEADTEQDKEFARVLEASLAEGRSS